MTASEEVHLILEMLRAGVDDVQASILAVQEEEESRTKEFVGELLAGVEQCIEDLGLCSEILRSLVKKKVGEGLLVVPGAVFEVTWSTPTRRWEHERLRSVVAEAVLARARDPETGTITAPLSQLIQEALDTAGISYWRVGKLSELGVSANNYSEKPAAEKKVRMSRSGRPALSDQENQE